MTDTVRAQELGLKTKTNGDRRGAAKSPTTNMRRRN
jgi:hypothetical protein